jgi:choline dehydrogenase-like flavoprotein
MPDSLEKNPYDCIVVGSGAAGGWAAMELTSQGLNVLVLEAGPLLDPSKDFMAHQWPYQSKHRGRLPLREQQFYPYTTDEYTSHIFVDNRLHPYVTPPPASLRLGSR